MQPYKLTYKLPEIRISYFNYVESLGPNRSITIFFFKELESQVLQKYSNIDMAQPNRIEVVPISKEICQSTPAYLFQ